MASALRMLADPVRLQIVSLLAGAEEACLCDLTPEVGVSQPTVSHHLWVLSEAASSSASSGDGGPTIGFVPSRSSSWPRRWCREPRTGAHPTGLTTTDTTRPSSINLGKLPSERKEDADGSDAPSGAARRGVRRRVLTGDRRRVSAEASAALMSLARIETHVAVLRRAYAVTIVPLTPHCRALDSPVDPSRK